jgi:DNA-binding transcriptional LysR family regulator
VRNVVAEGMSRVRVGELDGRRDSPLQIADCFAANHARWQSICHRIIAACAVPASRAAANAFTLRKVAEIDRVLCAAPAYLAEHPAPAEPADLLQHDCLLLRYPGSEQFRWTLVDGQETVTLPVAGHIDADDGDTLTAWALAGEGIVLKPLFEVAAHLAEGRLVQVLEHTPPTSVTLGLLYPSRKMLSARTKTFVDMTHEALRQHVSEQLALVGARAV